jgi:hypothetical protein
MATTTGTDIESYFFSINQTPAGAFAYAYGLGGPNPTGADAIPTPPVFNPPNPQGLSGILKINAVGLTMTGVQVAQGFYDSLNIADASKNVLIQGDFGIAGPAGERSMTIKGDCENIIISGTVHLRGTSFWDGDISLDDWLDQNYAASDGIDISGLVCSDGKPLVVVSRLFCTKGINFGPHKHALFRSLYRAAYYYFKLGVRTLLKIPVGTAGPSWLS